MQVDRPERAVEVRANMKAPGHRALKKGTRLERGKATQIVTYPRPRAKAALVEASRKLNVSLSGFLVGVGLAIAAKVDGCSISDLVPEDELRQYMRGRKSVWVSAEFWDTNLTTADRRETGCIRTGGTMTTRTFGIQEIEDRLQKLQALAALLRDPALDDVVSKLFGETKMSVSTDISLRGNVRPSPATVTDAIREIASDLPQPFTASDVVHHLKEKQFEFRRSALSATRDALYRLSRGKRRIFRILEVGQGGEPNRYTLVR